MILENLHKSIDELEPSVRLENCLNSAGIKTVGQLVRMTEEDLLTIKNMGRTSLREINRILADMGLSLGMSEVEIHKALCKNYRPSITEDDLAEVASAEAAEAAVANALGITSNEEQTKAAEDFMLVHGFNLNVSSVDGKPTIFLLAVFPEHIVGLDSSEPSGANVTLRETNGKTITLHVTQSVEEVKCLMERCGELDNRAKSQ